MTDQTNTFSPLATRIADLESSFVGEIGHGLYSYLRTRIERCGWTYGYPVKVNGAWEIRVWGQTETYRLPGEVAANVLVCVQFTATSVVVRCLLDNTHMLYERTIATEHAASSVISADVAEAFRARVANAQGAAYERAKARLEKMTSGHACVVFGRAVIRMGNMWEIETYGRKPLTLENAAIALVSAE